MLPCEAPMHIDCEVYLWYAIKSTWCISHGNMSSILKCMLFVILLWMPSSTFYLVCKQQILLLILHKQKMWRLQELENWILSKPYCLIIINNTARDLTIISLELARMCLTQSARSFNYWLMSIRHCLDLRQFPNLLSFPNTIPYTGFKAP